MNSEIPEISLPNEDEPIFAPEPTFSQTTLNKAYDLFLQTDMDLSDIALDLGVSSKLVASWARKGKWVDRKRGLEEEEMQAADAKYRSVVRENRVPVVKRHLAVSGKLEEGIEKFIDVELDKDAPNPVQLERMSRALAASTGVSARAAGITEKPHEDTIKESKKTPLILLNVNPSPVQPRDIGVDVKVHG